MRVVFQVSQEMYPSFMFLLPILRCVLRNGKLSLLYFAQIGGCGECSVRTTMGLCSLPFAPAILSYRKYTHSAAHCWCDQKDCLLGEQAQVIAGDSYTLSQPFIAKCQPFLARSFSIRQSRASTTWAQAYTASDDSYIYEFMRPVCPHCQE